MNKFAHVFSKINIKMKKFLFLVWLSWHTCAYVLKHNHSCLGYSKYNQVNLDYHEALKKLKKN